MVTNSPEDAIPFSNLMKEVRSFTPSNEFVAHANVQGMAAFKALYAEAKADPDMFWAKQAAHLDWMHPYETVLNWQEPHAHCLAVEKSMLPPIAWIVTLKARQKTKQPWFGKENLAINGYLPTKCFITKSAGSPTP